MAQEYNRGNLGEALLTASIISRFLSKTKHITQQDIFNLIKKLQKPITTTGTSYSSIGKLISPNANTQIKDVITYIITLPEKEKNIFFSQKFDQIINKDTKLKTILNSAVNYANISTVKEWADILYNNNKIDRYEITSEAFTNTIEQKQDLRIKIDELNVNLLISIKTLGAAQFGQVKGTDWRHLKNLFDDIVSVQSFKSGYDKIGKTNPGDINTLSEQLRYIYEQVNDRFNQIQSDSVKQEKISKFIQHHATKSSVDNFNIVDLDTKINVYDFNRLFEKFKDNNISIKCEKVDYETNEYDKMKPKIKLPKIRFIDASPNAGRYPFIVGIRCRVEKKDNYYSITHVIERFSRLKQIASTILK